MIFLDHLLCMIILYGGLAPYSLWQTDHNLICRKLKQISVTGKDCRIHSCRFAFPGQSSQNIIRFVAFFCHNIHTHCSKHFFNQRYLLSQFFRHGFTCSLVCFKHLMAESRCLQVKCHCQILRLLFLDRPKKDIQETIYCPCVFSF